MGGEKTRENALLDAGTHDDGIVVAISEVVVVLSVEFNISFFLVHV